MSDVLFLFLVFAFFALAVAFMYACGLVVREPSTEGRDR